jgi:hypothetical protein
MSAYFSDFLNRMAASGTSFHLDMEFEVGRGWKITITDTGSSMSFSAEGCGQVLDDAIARLEQHMA